MSANSSCRVKNSTIFTLFFIESGLLGAIGGVIGILIGVALGLLAEKVGDLIGGAGSALIQVQFPLSLIIGALTFSFLLGAVSGIIPAMQAAKLHPVVALQKAK